MVKKNNKNIIIGVCIATLAIAIIIVAIAFSAKNNVYIDDAYFVSDDTKYVLALDRDALSIEGTDDNTIYRPDKAYIVYRYSGEKITDMTSYLEFADNTTVQMVFPVYEEVYTSQEASGVKSISTNGRYIVITATSDQYSNISATELIKILQTEDYSLNETDTKTEE